MPLYEYQCRGCEHSFEQLVYSGDEVECPKCKSSELDRLLSVPARPRTQGTSLPMRCDPGLPPCGPGCCPLP